MAAVEPAVSWVDCQWKLALAMQGFADLPMPPPSWLA
jgi:hypothetical protein